MNAVPARRRRARCAAAAASLTALLLTGCATSAPTAEPPAAETSTETPTPTPTPVDIRSVDLGTRTVMYSPGGFSAPAWIVLADGVGTDEVGAAYAMGDPVYSDANGDGLEDALVAIERTEGTAWESIWYAFLADGEGDAAQLGVPLARASACGDLVESTAAAPGGGFAVEVLWRVRGTDDEKPCSEPGSGRESRVIVVDGEAGDPQAMPVQTGPVTAWGGICPGTTWWDTESSMVELLALPVAGSPIAHPATASAGIFPASQDPAPLLGALGVPTEGWAFVTFIGEQFAMENIKPMTCAWGAAA